MAEVHSTGGSALSNDGQSFTLSGNQKMMLTRIEPRPCWGRCLLTQLEQRDRYP